MKLKLSWLVLSFFPAVVLAVQPVRVVVEGYEDFARGTCRSTSLDDRGILRPAPALRRVAEFKPSQVWSMVDDRNGYLWVGTGPNGELLRVTPQGKTETVCKFNETHLYALTRTTDGRLFIATSPDGKIYRLDAANKPQVYFEPKEKYIWALVADKNGVLYAATGTEGRIYRITGEGKGSVYFDSDEIHIRSLAWDNEGRLLAGSAETGLLYRITGQDQALALAATGRQEVNQIVTLPDGTICFTATGQGKGAAARSVFPAAGGGAATGLRSLQLTVEAEDAPKPGSAPNLQPPIGRAGFNSLLCRIDKKGFVQALFGTPETLLSLVTMNGQVWAGSGGAGHLYSVEAAGHVARLLKMDAESPTTFVRAADGTAWIGASNPGSLWKLGETRREEGIYESEIIDSGVFARWGSVRVSGHGRISLQTRSGNTPKPDKSWNPWVEVKQGHSCSPDARYAQIQLRLQDADISRLEFFLLPRNLAPHVTDLAILPPGIEYEPIFQPLPPAQPKTADQLLAERGRGGEEMHQPTRYQPTEKMGFRTVVWKAEDPNEDTLKYAVYYRPEGSTPWRPLGQGLDLPLFSWDTASWPEGRYEVKVVASDAPSNPKGADLTAEESTRGLLIDHTPPRIQVLRTGSDFVEFQVTEELGSIASVRISQDGQHVWPVIPMDGVPDAVNQRYVVPYDNKKPLYIRAEDDSGNTSGVTVPTRP